jgi:hypothetical protein
MGMILDLGDPGRYNDVLMLDTMKKTRDKTNEMINNSLKEVGLPVPQITGPTHKLPQSQPDEIPNLTNPTTLNDVLALVMNEYALTYADGIWQNIANIEELSSVELEEIIDQLQMIAYSYFETIDGQDYLLKRSCEYFSGIYLNNQCSYSNKESCDNSYDWNKIKANINSNNVEYKDDVDINYAEWRVATTDGQSACVSVDPSLRLGCEDKNLPYDYNNQVCTLSEVYCRSRGLDPVTNSDGTTDCNKSLGQNIAEMIFGVTIVRGLIQIFDAQQYNSCGPGEVDTGYLFKQTDGDAYLQLQIKNISTALKSWSYAGGQYGGPDAKYLTASTNPTGCLFPGQTAFIQAQVNGYPQVAKGTAAVFDAPTFNGCGPGSTPATASLRFTTN